MSAAPGCKRAAKGLAWQHFAIPVLLFLLTVLVLLPTAPHLQPVPNTDSSVFLYMGQRVLDGGIPYRDVWDHKGPLIYYIDALGLGIGSGSRWGVWLLEALFVFGAAWLAFDFMTKVFSRWPAVFATGLFLLKLNLVLDDGNLVEEYALLFQFLMLWLFWRGLQTHRPLTFGWIGAVAALGFLLRPNIVAIPLAIGGYLIWEALAQRKDIVWKQIGAALGGGLLTLAVVTLYFYINGALTDFWSAAFSFNFVYDAANFGERWNAVQFGLELLAPATLFALTAWIFAFVAFRAKGRRFASLRPLLLILLLALPLEILLTSLPRLSYPHYYLTWLPSFTVLAAFFIYYLGQHIPEAQKQSLGRADLVRLLSLGLLIAFGLLPILRLLPTFFASVQSARAAHGLPPVSLAGNRLEPALIYLDENVPANEPLLVWGNQVALNWLTGRDAPSRFVYQQPFFQPGYVTEKLVSEYIEDLRAHPGVIIDATTSGVPFPPLTEVAEKLPAIVRPLYQYIQLNYVQVATLGRTGWTVYRYSGEITP